MRGCTYCSELDRPFVNDFALAYCESSDSLVPQVECGLRVCAMVVRVFEMVYGLGIVLEGQGGWIEA